MVELIKPPESDRGRLARHTLTVGGIVIAILLGLAILWVAAKAFLLIFAGLLLASVLCGIAKAFQFLGLPRRGALALTLLILTALIGGALAWGGIMLVEQFNSLTNLVSNQINDVAAMLHSVGLESDEGSLSENIEKLLPSGTGLFTSVTQILGALGNVFVVIFISIFVSWQPEIYRGGVISLFPNHKRARINEVLEKCAHELMLWLGGQAISMSVIFVVSWVGLWAIGMPNNFVLALQAGLLAFVPTLGPFVAGVVIALAGLAVSPVMALYAIGVYILIQGVESNVSQPIAQRFTSALAPALTLSAQLVFALLFGVVGVALAVPILAVLMILVQELYIKDALGGPVVRKAD